MDALCSLSVVNRPRILKISLQGMVFFVTFVAPSVGKFCEGRVSGAAAISKSKSPRHLGLDQEQRNKRCDFYEKKLAREEKRGYLCIRFRKEGGE